MCTGKLRDRKLQDILHGVSVSNAYFKFVAGLNENGRDQSIEEMIQHQEIASIDKNDFILAIAEWMEQLPYAKFALIGTMLIPTSNSTIDARFKKDMKFFAMIAYIRPTGFAAPRTAANNITVLTHTFQEV